MEIIRHEDGSLTVPIAPVRETADDDADAPVEAAATEMVIRPGEGGYNEALAEWDLQQNPDRGESVSTVSGREQAMAVVHAVAEDPDHVAEAVESLDDPEAGAEALRHVLVGGTPSVQAFASEVADAEAGAEALRHVLVGGTPSVQAFASEVAEAEGGDELPPHKATKIIGEVLAEIDTHQSE